MPNWIIRASRGHDAVAGQDEDFTHQFWADDKQDAEDYINSRWTQLLGTDPTWFLVSLEEQKTHGGYRPGSGRPTLPQEKKAKPKTVAKRIPIQLAENLDKVNELLSLVKDWRERSNNSSSTSPRWNKLREFLNDVDQLGIK